MTMCPARQHPATKRHGHDGTGRQRFLCTRCRQSFTGTSGSAFSGYRWPPEVILIAVRWYLSHPLSASSVMVFLAERGIDVSKRTVLRWVQTFGPLLAAEVRKHRRRPGRTWYVDEVFFFRAGGKEKRYLYRAIDEHDQVLDVHFREHRDTASAEAFFRRALTTTGLAPTIERSHIPTRDRLRSSRGLKTLRTGQRFFEGFEAVQALGHGQVHLERLVPGYRSLGGTPHDRARAVATAITTLGSRLRRAA